MRYVLTLIIFLTGCASDLDRYSANGGVLNAHFLAGTYTSVEQKANSYCESRGMSVGQINKISTGCLAVCGSEFSQYEFSCVQGARRNMADRSARSDQDLEQAKAECESIGFRPSTEAFGNCVLKLTEGNADAPKSRASQIDSERNWHKRQDAIEALQDTQKRQNAARQREREMMDDAHDQFKQKNQRSMCESWGNRYCY
jgi:hypothetical protein